MATITKIHMSPKQELLDSLEELLASKVEIEGFALLVKPKNGPAQYMYRWEDTFDLLGRLTALSHDLSAGMTADTEQLRWDDEGQD